jgi:hypothetical protein
LPRHTELNCVQLPSDPYADRRLDGRGVAFEVRHDLVAKHEAVWVLAIADAAIVARSIAATPEQPARA